MVVSLTFLVSFLVIMDSNPNYITLTQRESGQYLTYAAPIDPKVKGQTFYGVNASVVAKLLPKPIKLHKSYLKDFVVVSAISAKYYKRLTKLVASVQKHFPKNKMIIFDLGLSEKEHAQVI